MKKSILFICITLILACTLFPIGIASGEESMNISAKGCYLTDENGLELYARNENERFPIASMVKIMTSLLAFEDLATGSVSLDESIRISQSAMDMGGSQMFLEAGDEYTFSDLLKGIIVVSANDACVAVAERLSGDESLFVDRMNKRASELGMYNTHFANCTGLPCSGGYSSAKDCSIMLRELIKHEVYHNYSKIWLEEYTHPDGRTTIMTNTNKLIRFYEGCDGGKTGFTSEAGFCLSVTAKRGDLRVISVVIGEENSKTRFEDSKKLLNYAFANCKIELLAKEGEGIGEIKIKGARESIPYGVAESLGVVVKRGEQSNAELLIETNKPSHPILKGDKVGVAKLINNGELVKECDIIALENSKKESFGDTFDRVISQW